METEDLNVIELLEKFKQFLLNDNKSLKKLQERLSEANKAQNDILEAFEHNKLNGVGLVKLRYKIKKIKKI